MVNSDGDGDGDGDGCEYLCLHIVLWIPVTIEYYDCVGTLKIDTYGGMGIEMAMAMEMEMAG